MGSVEPLKWVVYCLLLCCAELADLVVLLEGDSSHAEIQQERTRGPTNSHFTKARLGIEAEPD